MEYFSNNFLTLLTNQRQFYETQYRSFLSLKVFSRHNTTKTKQKHDQKQNGNSTGITVFVTSGIVIVVFCFDICRVFVLFLLCSCRVLASKTVKFRNDLYCIYLSVYLNISKNIQNIVSLNFNINFRPMGPYQNIIFSKLREYFLIKVKRF